MPGLHISLGSYLKFFNMLKSQSRIIDFKIMALTRYDNKLSEKKIQTAITSYQEIIDMEQGIQKCEETIELIQEAAASTISKTPEKEDDILSVFQPRVDYFVNKIKEKVCIINFTFHGLTEILVYILL